MTYTDRSLYLAELNQIHQDIRLGRYVGFIPEETPTGIKCPECGWHRYSENMARSPQMTMFQDEPAQEYWLTCEDCGANFDQKGLAIPQRKRAGSEITEPEMERARRIA
jgi:hypothetical protein